MGDNGQRERRPRSAGAGSDSWVPTLQGTYLPRYPAPWVPTSLGTYPKGWVPRQVGTYPREVGIRGATELL